MYLCMYYNHGRSTVGVAILHLNLPNQHFVSTPLALSVGWRMAWLGCAMVSCHPRNRAVRPPKYLGSPSSALLLSAALSAVRWWKWFMQSFVCILFTVFMFMCYLKIIILRASGSHVFTVRQWVMVCGIRPTGSRGMRLAACQECDCFLYQIK